MRLSEPFYLLANDTFCDMSPEKYWDINPIETSLKALSGMHHTIRIFSDIGINAIVDHVLLKADKTMEECVELLHDYPVLFVHVICPISELRRREKERGNRDIGQGESQLLELNPQDTYDITVDTFNNTKEECADKIISLLSNSEEFTALKTLWLQRKGNE
jgi:chloramphenicol 3-O phosphotransferase